MGGTDGVALGGYLIPEGPLPASSVVRPSYFQGLSHAVEGASPTCQILRRRRNLPPGAVTCFQSLSQQTLD